MRFSSLFRFSVIALVSCGICAGAFAKGDDDDDGCTECTHEFFVDAYKQVIGRPIGGGDIDLFLLRAKMTKCNLCESTTALNQGRRMLVKVIATEEQLEQLRGKQTELDGAKKQKDKDAIQVELDQMQDEIIQTGVDDGAYAEKELDDTQKQQVADMSFNIALAGVYEALAVKDVALMIKEGKDITAKIKSDKRQAIKLAPKAKKITTFVTKDAPAITKAVPEHTKSFAKLTAALKALKEKNAIEDGEEATAGATFKEIPDEDW